MGGKRPGAGRKAIKIDLIELEKLASLWCTDAEFAAWFRVSIRTIESRRKQPQFADAISRGRAKGQISVRRAQMRLLDAGNATMAVWLGKQLLGQRDVTPVELSGPNGEPVKLSLEALDAAITRAEQRRKTPPDR